MNERHRILIIQTTHANCVDLCALSLRSCLKLCSSVSVWRSLVSYLCVCVSFSTWLFSCCRSLAQSCAGVGCRRQPTDTRTHTDSHKCKISIHSGVYCAACVRVYVAIVLCQYIKIGCVCGARLYANTLSARVRNKKCSKKKEVFCV